MTNKQIASKISTPYASALLELAVSTQTVDYVTTDINDLLKIFKENKNLTDYLTNPLYSKESKKSILKKLIEPQLASQNTSYFIMLLIDRSRIDLFEVIAKKYLYLVYDLAKIQIAEVKSAFGLTPQQELEIIAQLKKQMGAKEIKLVTSIDKSLLGGFQIQIGSNIIDVSLKGQLNQLATQLETTLF